MSECSNLIKSKLIESLQFVMILQFKCINKLSKYHEKSAKPINYYERVFLFFFLIILNKLVDSRVKNV